MANNYTESSSKLRLNADEIERAKVIVDRVIKEFEDDPEGPGYYEAKVTVEDDGVWVCHDESIDVAYTADLFQALLDELEIDDPFVFSWSYNCSQPRLNEFGGGACALKRGEPAFWVDAMQLAQDHFRRAE